MSITVILQEDKPERPTTLGTQAQGDQFIYSDFEVTEP